MTRTNDYSYGRPTAEEEFNALADILAHAFNFKAEDAAPWFDKAGRDNIRTVRASDAVVAGMMILPMGQYFGGQEVSMAGIAGVGVKPTYWRQGYASRMMRDALAELREGDYALSTLYASNQPLYRAVGYEQAGGRYIARISPQKIDIVERTMTVRPFDEADREAVYALYKTSAKGQAGALERSEYIWDRLSRLRWGNPAHGILVEDDRGTLQGYLFYRKTGPTGDRHELSITDCVAHTERAARRLWTQISDFGPMVKAIELPSSPTDPFYFLLPHPFAKMQLWENWLLRIVNVERALSERGYPEALTATVELEVRDETLNANQGRYALSVTEGQVDLSRGGRGKIECDIRALAAIYSGFATPQMLRSCGLLDGSEEELKTLAAIFAGPAPWMRESF